MNPALLDPSDVDQVREAPGLLREFNQAGILLPADVHVAVALGRLVEESRSPVLLAAALAVRAPRLGHVYADLATIRDTVAVEGEVPADLAWPDPYEWVEQVAGSPLVAVDDGSLAPLRLHGSRLYCDRYWSEESEVADALLAMNARAGEVDPADVPEGLERMFGQDGRQRQAAACALLRRLTVIAGGPGTGKTTTVARAVALIYEQALARGEPLPLVGLAAPTGKAAARLGEAVYEEAERLDVSAAVREELQGLRAMTLHRLLGRRPDSHSRFRHHAGQRLPHDVIVVDETSMVSLSLMARLLEAVRTQARLVLVGDPGQLASVEAGAVLADVVGPAAAGAGIGDGIVVLDRVHRYGAGIAALADGVRRGEDEEVVQLLRRGGEDVEWLEVDTAAELDAPGAVRQAAEAAARQVVRAALAGEADEALAALASFRLLCAHRQGPAGVTSWNARVEGWLASTLGAGDGEPWYAGRPLLVTRNDPELGLFNGDTGVIVAGGAAGELRAVFPRGRWVVSVSPARLEAVQTAYAMTIHKSQGSQFEAAAVLLPEPESRILNRELLYTAVTRAQRQLLVVGSEASVRAAVARRVARASGLRERLWGNEI